MGFPKFGGFGSWGSGTRPPSSSKPRLPENVIISGGYPSGSIRAASIDTAGRLILVPFGLDVEDHLPERVVSTGAAIHTNTSGYDRFLTYVSVVNLNEGNVSLKLFLAATAEALADAIIWGAPGVILSPNAVWEWWGRWPIHHNHRLSGIASVANSLYITLGIEKQEEK